MCGCDDEDCVDGRSMEVRREQAARVCREFIFNDFVL